MSNHAGGRPNSDEIARRIKLKSDWDKVQEKIKRHVSDRFARCHCGTIEHLLMGETGNRFMCCECRAVRVARVIAGRKRKAA